MAIKQNATGRVLRVSALFDMSSNTELTLIIRKPDGVKISKTRTGGSITLGAVQVVDADLGTLNANEYIEYVIESGILDLVGEYTLELIYHNSGANEKLYGETVTLDVVRNIEDD